MSRFNTAQIFAYRQTLDHMAQNPKDQKSEQEKRRTNALPPPPPAAIASSLGVKTLTVEWLAGDGSDRCYYRILSPEISGSLVLMQLSGNDAQALKEDGYDWIKIARIIGERGVFVPKVFATMPDHAALIIEDYGDEMLEGRIFALAEADKFDAIRDLYVQCSQIIGIFLKIPRDPQASWCRRSFDEERFVWELNFFVQKYVVPAAQIHFTPAESRQFEVDAKNLARALSDNSHYFVHRDFHSRNVMVQNDKLAIIDFQDARLGPASYDLVSLCFDSYVPFSAETRRQVFQACLNALSKQLPKQALDDVESLWKPMLLQRQLKAIGSFGFLTLDKKRGDYLKYVDPALQTLEDHGVEDARWPFISGDLIRKMRERLRSHHG